jgi:hypothetical protein
MKKETIVNLENHEQESVLGGKTRITVYFSPIPQNTATLLSDAPDGSVLVC